MTSFIWKIEHIECVPPREAGADIWMILYFIHNTVLCKSQFIEINISYKISVNYCSIKMQIVIIFLFHTSKTFSNVELLSIYSQSFLELIFATKAKTMLLKQSAVLFSQLSKKYCVYYVSEHLKYFSRINEYWLNKNDCLNLI